MTAPITPDEVVGKKRAVIPPEVIDAFNELIAKNWNGRESDIKLREACQLIRVKLSLPDDAALENAWLDVEPIYREAGWVVKFESPVAYAGESFAAHYTFSKKVYR